MIRIGPRISPTPKRPAAALAAALLVWLTLLVSPPPAAAHAALLRSDPASGGSLAESPSAITLWFSETVELRYSTLTVVKTDGSTVLTGALASVGTPDEPTVRAELRDTLPRGSYTIVYSVLSAVDGHVSGGFFSFTVGDALMPSAEQQAELASQASSSSAVPLPVSSAVRWLNLLAQGVLSGLLLFLVAVLAPVASRSGAGGVPARRFRWLAAAALALLLAGHLAAALIQAMNATRSTSPGVVLDALPSILSETRFGAIWLARGTMLTAWALTAWALLRGARLPGWHGQGRLLWSAGLLVSALVLLTTSLGSHAATRGGATSWPVLTDWLHLIATSVWLGGLAGLLLAFDIAPAGTPRRDLLAGFSRLAMIAVVGIVATGAVSAWVEAYSWDGLISTDYGTWLIVKLVFVVGALGLGAHHLLNVRARLDAAVGDERRVAAGFRRSLRLEAVLAVAVVAATGVLTGTPPARDLLEGVEVLGSTRLVSAASITLRISPPEVGANEYSVVIAPSDLDTFGEIQRVYLRFTPLALDAPAGAAGLSGSQRVQLRQSGPADAFTFLGNGSFITLDGDWDVVVVIRRAGIAEDLEAPFGVTARDGTLALTGIPQPAADRGGAAIGLGAAWLASAAILVFGGWRLRRQRLSPS
ncbi:MAG TPA: copper resistance protein CopC [Thermomicrobiales bacterium]|nr:copper resistance protein CopC [Thermomicrobiales bacterium]